MLLGSVPGLGLGLGPGELDLDVELWDCEMNMWK